MAPVTPILALSGGELLPFIIGGVFLLVKWLISQAEEKTPPDAGPTNRPAGSTEEERARRFREALGLPPDGEPTSTRRTEGPSPMQERRHEPTTMREPAPTRVPPPPPAPRRSAPLPVPPIVYERRRREVRPAPPLPREVRESPSLDSLPEPTTRAEVITAGQLEVPAYHEFETTSSQVQAIPFERRDGPLTKAELREQQGGAAELRAVLRNPSTLRAALLLREILGPPLGLQSPAVRPTLRVP